MFAGVGTLPGTPVVKSNSALDITPNLSIPGDGTQVRVRLMNVQGLPNIRMSAVRKTNVTTTLEFVLMARQGISNGAADIRTIAPALVVAPPDPAGTQTTAAINTISAGQVCIGIRRTAGDANPTTISLLLMATS